MSDVRPHELQPHFDTMLQFHHAYVALAIAILSFPLKAEVLGNYDLKSGKGTPFPILLCKGSNSKRLVEQARSMGVQLPQDLVSTMRLLWCSIDNDDGKRLQSIRDRVQIPFEHVASGHDHLVEDIADLQSTIGSLSFGRLPDELEVEISAVGQTITLRALADLDSWRMTLNAGRWQIQSMSLCECED